MKIQDGYLKQMAKVAREFRIPTDRVYAACEKYLETHNCGWMAALVIIEDRLMDTGQSEPLEGKRCVNCRGTKNSPLSGCRFRWHEVDPQDGGWVEPPQHSTLIAEGRIELLPCRKCGELPKFTGSKVCKSYRFSCKCATTSRVSRDSLARVAWNRKFGSAPKKADDLPLCKCGQIPRPVAYISNYLKEWYWGHYCDCGVRGGHSVFLEQVGWMRREDKNEVLQTDISSHRYDLPTDLVLGGEKLPEEYR